MYQLFAVESAKLRVPPTFLCWLSELFTHAVGIVPLLKLLPESIHHSTLKLLLLSSPNAPVVSAGKVMVLYSQVLAEEIV